MVLSALAQVVPTTSGAAQNCKRGIPCGRSCISASKVCRIGTPTPEPAAAPPPATPRPFVAGPSALTAPEAPAATAAEFPWVGSFADGVFFRSDCPPAQDLADSNRRYFRTMQRARAIATRGRRGAKVRQAESPDEAFHAVLRLKGDRP